MNDVQLARSTLERRGNAAESVTAAGDNSRALTFALELHSMSALLTALTTLARLGCRVTSIQAANCRALIGLTAPQQVAHRVPLVLGQLIEVITVNPTAMAPAADYLDDAVFTQRSESCCEL